MSTKSQKQTLDLSFFQLFPFCNILFLQLSLFFSIQYNKQKERKRKEKYTLLICSLPICFICLLYSENFCLDPGSIYFGYNKIDGCFGKRIKDVVAWLACWVIASILQARPKALCCCIRRYLVSWGFHSIGHQLRFWRVTSSASSFLWIFRNTSLLILIWQIRDGS